MNDKLMCYVVVTCMLKSAKILVVAELCTRLQLKSAYEIVLKRYVQSKGSSLPQKVYYPTGDIPINCHCVLQCIKHTCRAAIWYAKLALHTTATGKHEYMNRFVCLDKQHTV